MNWNIGDKAPLRLYRAIQVVWALALLAFVAPMIVARGFTWPGLLYLAAFAMFGVASLGIYADHRWAWIISIAFLAVYWVLRGWMAWANFVVNFYMFFTGHELYRDSPLTITVVVTYALFGIFPATCLLILGMISSRHILTILRGRHPTGPVAAG